jgi:parvulin-like peptidyl-prolyl isomerase
MLTRARSYPRRLGGLAVCSLLLSSCSRGCSEAPSPQPAASSSAPAQTLSPELKEKVLAKVGGREITLGEYAATLERMGEFERLRYQSPERRKQLLDEMIEVELLAGEARRRGLHERPETQARLRQALRDELMRQERQSLPSPSEIPTAEVRAYFEKHKNEFREPERRRVAHIELDGEKRAQEILELAEKAEPKEWGRLVRKHSLDRRPPSPLGDPIEFAGDLGIVAKPGSPGGENPEVPEPVRSAVFEIDAIGHVYPKLVTADGHFHIVRMIGKTDARNRSFVEAERLIRVRLLEERAEKLEKDLEKRLRERFRVVVDEKALDKLELPKAGASTGN